LKHPLKWPAQVGYQKQGRPRRAQKRNGHKDSRIPRRGQAEADEQNEGPEHQHYQEQRWDLAIFLLASLVVRGWDLQR